MFKYVASKEVLKKYDSILKNSKHPYDAHYFLAISIVGTSAAYFQCGNFWKNYKSIVVYSPKKLTKVPLNGILISTEWFEETQEK